MIGHLAPFEGWRPPFRVPMPPAAGQGAGTFLRMKRRPRMAIDAGADAPTDASGSRLRLTLDQVDAVHRLRDYLRRLGLEPDVHGSLALEVDGDGHDIEQAV